MLQLDNDLSTERDWIHVILRALTELPTYPLPLSPLLSGDAPVSELLRSSTKVYDDGSACANSHGPAITLIRSIASKRLEPWSALGSD